MKRQRPEEIFSWLPKDDRLNPFYQGIVEFVNEETKEWTQSKKYSYYKEVLDPCVGYIKIYSWEWALLDTMLFQRLRKITQLGLANLVYPSLSYSRFEHTLGVLGRLHQVLTRIRDKQIKGNEKVNDIINKYETQIRLAALFHDIGHCLFSHLSEFAINDLQGYEKGYEKGKPLPEGYYPSVKTIIDIFNNSKELIKGHTNLSIFEIFSITILGTERVAQIIFNNNPFIYQNSKENGKKIDNPNLFGEELLKQSALFIAGLPAYNEPETIFLAQLMSSGLDTDKLDYMSREELFSGIKIEMDLQRIFNKIDIFEKSRSELSKSLKKYTKHIEYKKNDTRPFIVLGINKGGQFAYEEFCVARLSLYEKIYLHKKVRAAESFMRKQLKCFIGNNEQLLQAHKWLSLTESIIEISRYKIPEVVQEGLFTFIDEKEVEIYFSDIFKRQIPDRAFGFGPSNCETDKHKKEEILSNDDLKKIASISLWDFLRKEKEKNELKNNIEEFEEKIIIETQNIVNFIDRNEIRSSIEPDLIPKNDDDTDWNKIKNTLVIDVPDYNRVQLKPQTLHFEDIGASDTVNWTIPIDNIHKSYLLHKILAYVYVNHRFCPLISIATELVLHKYKIDNQEMDFRFNQSQTISIENQNKIKNIKQILDEKGFYDIYPKLKPINEELTSALAVELMDNVVRNFYLYEYGTHLTRKYVKEFLEQFDKDIQLPLLHLISNIKVLSPFKEVGDKLKEIKNSDKLNGSKIGALPLGGIMSSSCQLYHDLQNIFTENGINILSFNDKNISSYTHILFVDDNINTGIQCLNFMMRNLGYNENNIVDDNERKQLWSTSYDEGGETQQVSDEFKEDLKNKKIIFLFITGYEHSENDLKGYLTKHCQLNNDNIEEIYIIHKIKDEDKIFYTEKNGKYNHKEYKKVDDKNLTIFEQIKKDFIDTGIQEKHIKKIHKILEEKGIALVKEKDICKKHKQEPKQNALGHRNRENLVIFTNSIPKMTYTALWCEGKYVDEKGTERDWKPLIKRR